MVAPSLVPSVNRRVKTDHRDAVGLAEFLRSGHLVAVAIPDAATEAVRDLVRARDAAKRAERVARQQLDKLLSRHGRHWSGATNWTQGHGAWLRSQRFEERALPVAFDDAVGAVEAATERVAALTSAIGEVVPA